MYFLCAVLIEELYRLSHLCAADDTVIDKEELLSLDKLMNGYKLHLGNYVSHALIRRHEASRPCGGILYKRTCKRDTAPVCVADSVRCSRIRDSAYEINVRKSACCDVVFSHYLAVAGTHDFNVDALIAGCRVAVICPEEGAYLHLGGVALCHYLAAVSCYLHYLACGELLNGLVAELLECEGFSREAVAVPALADNNRKSAVLVAGCDDAVACEDYQRHRALYLALRVADTVYEVVTLRDKSCDKVAGVDITARHRLEVCTALFKELVNERVGIADYTY